MTYISDLLYPLLYLYVRQRHITYCRVYIYFVYILYFLANVIQDVVYGENIEKLKVYTIRNI